MIALWRYPRNIYSSTNEAISKYSTSVKVNETGSMFVGGTGIKIMNQYLYVHEVGTVPIT